MASVIDSSEIPRFWLRLKFQCASGVSPDTGPGPGYIDEDADGQYIVKLRERVTEGLEKG